ncbi:stage III sporulation protein AF [Lutispora thermophila]|uniref:Stage III sporulation protein AF n=1 Tax=Lutispora thermophila DSM 19022 TaxID=1122184 RepID=A0A1M6F522_9FIRM|nr:stage III sporulation protein AF [Lutispora thermophila]SHI92770.1 stage III sporulation protein AF [Lutispora thermophila DSM 19022]
MMEFIRNWIINIVIVIIFLTITDIVLPEGSVKKYIKVIIGTFVLLTIIQPLINISDVSSNFQKSYLETSIILNGEKELIDKEVLSSYQSMKAIDIYESKLKDQIASAISYKTSINKNNINIVLDINKNQHSNEFGSINNVSITLNTHKEVNNIEKVKKVDIREKEKVIYVKEEEYNFNEKTLTDEIKNMLSEILGIKRDKVQVKLLFVKD